MEDANIRSKISFTIDVATSESSRNLITDDFFCFFQPEGDPFSDRMKSFEKRSLIEPRKKVM